MLRRHSLLGLVVVCLTIMSIPTEVGARRTEPDGVASSGPAAIDVTGFVRVIDGDTVEAVIDHRRVGIGLIGISAPVGNTACGRDAATVLRQLVRGGIRLEPDPSLTLDERGRRMYRVLTPDGKHVGEELLKAGVVRLDRRGVGRARQLGSPVAADVDARLSAAEATAQAAGAGCVWGPRSSLEDQETALKSSSTEALPDTRSQARSGGEASQAMSVAAAPSSAALPAGFADELVAQGLTDPTSFALLPDGRILISEKAGLVKLSSGPGAPLTTFLDIRNRVNDYWDRGLVAVAADPNFATNRYVYAYYTYEDDPNGYYATKTGRLSRFTASDNTASPGTEVVILGQWTGPSCNAAPVGADCLPADGPSHNGGGIRFAADGTLFLSTGDAAHFNTVNDNALRAQNTSSLAGKVLHVTTTGAGLPSNPFWNGDAQASRSKVWAYGVRNGFRFGLRPGSGTPYLGDVGWGSWEEVNSVPPGANLGWPCYEGAARQDGYEPNAVCQSLYGLGAGAVRTPLVAYSTINGASVTGGTFYSGTAFPQEYQGAYFYGDYVKGWIRYLKVDAADVLVAGPTDFATAVAGPVDIQMGTDQALYYLTIYDGQLRRARYLSATNQPPTAAAAATPTAGPAPLSVQFTSAGSSSPSGYALAFTWNFGDGAPASHAADPQHVYASTGTYTATLTVDDGHGGMSSDSVTITVGSRPPTARIDTPASSFQFRVGDVVTYSGGAADPEDGTLSDAALAWQVILHHCPGGTCHTHTFVSATGPHGSFIVPDHGDESYFEIRLTATDSSGLTNTSSVTIMPRTVQLTISTVPPGMRVVYDGVSATGPLTRTTIAGSTHTIQVPSPQGRAKFAWWSDGGAQQHNITVGTSNVEYVATFDAPAIVTFDDRAGQDQPLTGQYPSGVIDWGAGAWYHAGPWGQITSKSVSFNSGTITTGTLTFITPRRLIGLDAYNGGGAASTVTITCAGQPTRSATVPAGQTVTLDTDWTGPCSAVTLSSTNGWDTNFDNLAYESEPLGNPPPTATPPSTPTATPTLTPTPTATLTPTPTQPSATVLPAWCAPRPQVRLTSSKSSAGQLNAVIAAQTSSATPTNRLISVRLTRIDNAAVRVNGTPVSEGQSVMLPEGAQQATLTVVRQTPDQRPDLGTTVSFEAVDVCGAWPSFVGGGPGAF